MRASLVSATIRALALLLLFSGPAGVADAVAPKELRIGLVPALSPQHFVQRFSPLATYLENQLGIPTVLVGAPNYAEFTKRAREGGYYDILLTGSDIYRYLAAHGGYRAIVRVGDAGALALIAVRVDSRLTELSDLVGKTVATADPLSLSHHLGTAKLRQAGIDLDADTQVLTTPTQNASMISMVNGLADAAIFMSPVLERAPPEVASQVRVIAETDRAASHPISVGPHLPEDLVGKIRAALLRMHEDPDGASMFEAMRWPHFVRAGPEDYASMDWAVQAIEAQLDASPRN